MTAVRPEQASLSGQTTVRAFGPYTIRDFELADEPAFMAYQMDPRYRALYDLDDSYRVEAAELFRAFGLEPSRAENSFSVRDLRRAVLVRKRRLAFRQ